MKKRTIPGWVLAVTLALASLGPTRLPAQQLQVIDLHYRLADDLIPVLQPLLEPGGVISGIDDKLIVRTSDANFRQIEAAVAALDRAPRQLLITVGQGTVRSDSAASVTGRATVGGGDVQVGVNRPPAAEPGAQVQAGAARQQADLHNVSSVRTLEGNETYIAIGQSAPVTTVASAPGGYRPGEQQFTQYRDVSTGFYATPRVSGDRVVLEISPRQQQLRGGARTGVVETQGATTTVRGRLGEWIEIGAVRDTRTASSAGLLVWGTRSDAADYSAWVKVDEVH